MRDFLRKDNAILYYGVYNVSEIKLIVLLIGESKVDIFMQQLGSRIWGTKVSRVEEKRVTNSAIF